MRRRCGGRWRSRGRGRRSGGRHGGRRSDGHRLGGRLGSDGLRSCGDGLRGCRLRRRRGRLHRGRGRSRGRAGLDERQDVLLRHPSARARPRDRARVDAVLGGDARDDGRDERPPVAHGRRRGDRRGLRDGRRRLGLRLGRRSGGRLGRRRGGSLGRRSGGSLGRRHDRGRGRPVLGGDRRGLGRGGLGRGGLGRGRRGLGAGRADARDHRPDLDGLTLLREDLGDDALAGARHLGVDLVGRDLEQGLVPGDRLARLLQPLRDRALGDGHAHLWHHDLGLRSCRHVSSSTAGAGAP